LESDLRRTERLAALGKLVAGVAHEVRNPLAGIRSTAQLCQRGAQFDSETASDLMAEVDRLDMIVARLLQFSRIGREPLQQANLNEVVAEAMRMIRPKAEENNVLIEFNFDHGLPQVAIAASSIIQVVRNLAHNAVEAMPHGGVLRIGTGRQSPRKYVYVSISDTGCGLSRQVKEHLFEPFFTTKNDGTGLGLAIAREIALAHGGNLTAQDRAEGAGATFILSLPVEAPQHALAAPANQIVKDTPAVVPDSVNSQRVMIEL
jgi:signal transduction histidine kinase